MPSVSSALSYQPDPARAANELARGLERIGPGRTSAALFFATPGYGPSYAGIERAIRDVLGPAEVVGCSAAGVISRAGERERSGGVSVLALRGDFEAQRFFIPSLRGRAEDVGREIGRAVEMVESEPRTVVLLGDSYNLAPDELLAGIESVAPGTVVVGAGASEDGTVGETTVIGRGTAASNAVAGLVLGGLRVSSIVSQGATPVGSWSTVTRAEGNRLLELDGKPALEPFLAQLPALLRDDLREALRRTRAALAPVEERSAVDPAYVVRRLLGADVAAGALLVGDEVMPGMRFAVAVRDPAAVRQSFARALERFVEQSHALAGVLYFDSVERGESLYGIADLETAYLRRSLGEVELAGFFSGVELAPLAGRNRFHQSSGVLLGFSSS